MKKKKLIGILLLIIIVVGTIIGISFKMSNDRDKEIEKEYTPTADKAKELIDSKFLSKDAELKTLERITNVPFSYNEIYLGKDSFVSTKPSSTFIKKHGLEAYEKLQSKYASIVENRFIQGTSYTYEKDANDNLIYKFKPWYFGAYSADLQYLLEDLINMTGDITKEDFMNSTEKYTVYEYKARVKAIYILNEFLDNYDNQDEEFTFFLTLKNGKITKPDLYSIYLNFYGNRSEKMPGLYEPDIVTERVDKYIKIATQEGLIKSRDVLNIEGYE